MSWRVRGVEVRIRVLCVGLCDVGLCDVGLCDVGQTALGHTSQADEDPPNTPLEPRTHLPASGVVAFRVLPRAPVQCHLA